ncbi:putative leucine-rich repeat-containing protein DDB_G0290503 isoform X1 [Conger conger]|uniref:putative leucine-rich repeat-containing protein DDB_G0290503 isoform X1 n=1 Tax=Conger conger TaxID=82655 RepID=UPI002A599298|nr:putative leucine-rich repeat-containing protein DDB_G0290503 isoform X1 [Conger conger]XP_061099857.1 putative leucine-rich repeat-containing protein DDB_G0290503 isoform X1 [Conger conger]XP_061099858.1 putative leucine-rich repeat-containing protein DDB_G0290503 isoform X1 [Conger conger]
MTTSEKLKESFDILSNLLMEELQKCLATTNDEMVLMELQFTEYEARFHDQKAESQCLTRTLEEKDSELQNLQAQEEGRDLVLLNAKADFEKAIRDLQANASRVLEERDVAICQLQEAVKKNTQDMEELQKLLAEAREETAWKEGLLSEMEVKLGDKAAKVQDLAATLEEKDQELQKLQAVQKARDLEIHNVRVAFQKAMQELETNMSCVLRENERVVPQLHGALNTKSEDLEDLQNPLVEAAHKELVLPHCELKLEDRMTEGQNLTTTLRGKDPEPQGRTQRRRDGGRNRAVKARGCRVSGKRGSQLKRN